MIAMVTRTIKTQIANSKFSVRISVIVRHAGITVVHGRRTPVRIDRLVWEKGKGELWAPLFCGVDGLRIHEGRGQFTRAFPGPALRASPASKSSWAVLPNYRPLVLRTESSTLVFQPDI